MKNYEKESFLKIFSIFFIVLSILSFVISYLYYENQISVLNGNILSQMKEYNFNFKGNKFIATIVKKDPHKKIGRLYITDKEVYALFYISKKSKSLLKIIYPKDRYENDIAKIRYKIGLLYIVALIIILFLSLLYAYYALKPMKKAVDLIEDFLKDVIHDINTPITTILLNTKYLMRKNPSDELERIEISANRILSLYKNFEAEIRGFHPQKNSFDIYEIVLQRVDYFRKLYPSIKIEVYGKSVIYDSDKDAFIRILDNILSNSCKYASLKDPKIDIEIKEDRLVIKDNGIGIKDISKVFERFYKENDRGIGIGMNIVKKLCDELGIKIKIESQKDKGTTVELTLE
ncbi:MAG: HAMP domain-containing histidine kinase [Epsilonproteobacteria bacterium]|nr:HAMP domain-containing histidine kinase [Campylobacterota bacterium]